MKKVSHVRKIPPVGGARLGAALRERNSVMRKVFVAAIILASAIAISSARADMVGAVAGAGTGLVVAGPPGAVVGGVVGAVWGKPFWGPSISRGHCWIDSDLHRHCSKHWN
jgi:hypothetical protein